MRYKRIEIIGEGGYGRIYKAKDSETGQLVALKKQSYKQALPERILMEIMALQQLQHENIVQLIDTVTKNDRVYLVLELFGSDLHQYMSLATLEEPLIQSYLFQLLSGLQYCHESGYLHRDLKPQNLLIDNDGLLKICDLGLACQRSAQPKTRLVCTLYYRAPELLLGAQSYDTAIDLWSVGCILGEMLRNEILFHSDCEIGLLYAIFRKLGTPTEHDWPDLTSLPYYSKFPNFSAQLSQLFKGSALDLISRLLTCDPTKRIGTAAALQHEYLKAVTWF